MFSRANELDTGSHPAAEEIRTGTGAPSHNSANRTAACTRELIRYLRGLSSVNCIVRIRKLLNTEYHGF